MNINKNKNYVKLIYEKLSVPFSRCTNNLQLTFIQTPIKTTKKIPVGKLKSVSN